MSLKNVNIKGSYTGKGSNILNDFLLPILYNSVEYDRITGYFTIDSLLSIANGIDSLRLKKGKMRLIVGIHSIPEDFLEATLKINSLKKEIAEIQYELENNIKSLTELLEKQKIATIAWMIEDGLLTVKVAAVGGTGIFHPKTIIVKDEEGNEVVAVGSSNETRNGLGGNYEQLMVATSWTNLDAVNDQKQFFNTLWDNQDEDAIVLDITAETAKMIKSSLGDDYEKIKKVMSTGVDDVFNHLSNMPVNYFISGNIPALYLHQERAVVDALSRWPVRVLFSDEVGLGKTFEAAATIAFLNRYCGVKRIVILTPKSVLQQWQDELKTHFGMDVWLYKSDKKEYISSNNEIIKIGNNNPLGSKSPDILLLSAQYARGSKGAKGILEAKDTILPDLLVVDEAHSARMTKDISGNNSKTKMYKMLESVSDKIPHIILATATPMQKSASEYYAILKLLGLPKMWNEEKVFLRSLQYLMNDEIVDLSEANEIVNLLYYAHFYMMPDLSILTAEEKQLMDNVIELFEKKDLFDNAKFVKQNWGKLKNVFIKLHPARLLTIRNTRRSLTDIGYKFPKRNLRAWPLYDSNEIKFFYRNVNKYLVNECFMVERELNPDKKLNISFTQVGYQQRVASSLHSCKRSLERRFEKILLIQKKLESGLKLKKDDIDLSYSDDLYLDDLLDFDSEDNTFIIKDNVDINNLRRAINTEYFSLSSLLKGVNSLLETEGDKKVDESIKLALEVLKAGDSVLLFSRYTDTVEALVEKFNKENADYNYAIYTGNNSKIVRSNISLDCDKEEIKKALFSKDIKIVFCSDAASEGINLQAARVLINVDVPWTPARLEQRIGRIARLGQTAREVDIYNVWYPSSVEAKMYQRIQTRFRDSNIAIGEFPNVVAENIKNSILYDTDDDSLEMLKNIRNDLQKDALNQLSIKSSEKTSYSEMLRKKLIEICKDKSTLLEEDVDNNYYAFLTKNGKKIELSPMIGRYETISLKSELLKELKSIIYGASISKNEFYEIAFKDIKNGRLIKTESILENLKNKEGTSFNYYVEYPILLPNFKCLNLCYAVKDFNKPNPVIWTENDGD